MPEICRFYGIIIQMYAGDHPPPHFHAKYAEHTAKIDLRTLGIIEGELPPRALGLTIEWARQYQADLLVLWERVERQQPLYKLPPLK